MLSLITVKNYAVVHEVEVEFGNGLSVMTGETGAGKSILVDALGLALGERTDTSAVRAGAPRAEISAVFDYPRDHAAAGWLEDRGLEGDGSCVLRRVVYAEGRSRAFINGQSVTGQDLRALGSLLVNIHGQSAHQALLRESVQRRILDHHGDHRALSDAVASRFDTWHALRTELARRTGGAADRAAELELLRFQARELQALDLGAGELESLTAERNRLANVERLTESVGRALEALYEGEETSAQRLIAQGRRELEGLAELDPALEGPGTSLDEAEIHVREAAGELARFRDRLEPDPQRLDWVQARLAKIREIAHRHGVEASDLGGVLTGLEARIEALENASESLESLTARTDGAEAAYFQAAAALTAARQQAADALGAAVCAQITELGLLHGRFQAVVTEKAREQADAQGLDRVEFQVALNPGQPFGPVSKVASGGELSRISLALEVVGAGATAVPTLVFDEVDAGIGGRTAEIVGRRLAEIAGRRQVLCVTHLAQVASQGSRHYRVAKSSDGHSTRTSVHALDPEERVEELSRMLGGLEITARTRAHAEEMIQRAAR